jgi:hypothetical protein
MTNLSDDKKVEILIHFQNNQTQELMYRRGREFNIFLWTATIFLVFIGSLLLIDKSREPIWQHLGFWGKFFASCLILLIASFSIIWQNRERVFANNNCKVIVATNEALNAFENNFYLNNQSIYPDRWRNWGKKELNSYKRYFRANYITAVWILGVLSVLIIWV